MKKLTNHMAGARGINLKGGGTRWIEPGETIEIDADTIEGKLPDLGNAKSDDADDTNLRARNEALEAENADLRAQLAKFDANGDGKAGGSTPAEPPALTGKNKADLLEIAKAEGVTVEKDATNGQIVDAIEKKRAAA